MRFAPKARYVDGVQEEIIEAGQLKLAIDRSYPLEQIAEAHAYAEQGHVKGKVVITMGHDDKI
ncbi:zinc-binding dehydrogenase [Chloroflexota bacterium]